MSLLSRLHGMYKANRLFQKSNKEKLAAFIARPRFGLAPAGASRGQNRSTGRILVRRHVLAPVLEAQWNTFGKVASHLPRPLLDFLLHQRIPAPAVSFCFLLLYGERGALLQEWLVPSLYSLPTM